MMIYLSLSTFNLERVESQQRVRHYYGYRAANKAHKVLQTASRHLSRSRL